MGAVSNQPPLEPPVDVRLRIIEAAARLVAQGGIAALTTRAVAVEASVQAPTLYRLFGDKRGLLDAVAEHGLAMFIKEKQAVAPHPDPVQDLRDAWDAYVAFGLANPAVFAIINEVGRTGPPSQAAAAGIAILQSRVRRIALAGKLRMPEDRAVALVHAVGSGTVGTLLTGEQGDRDPELSATARETVMAALVGADDPAGPSGPDGLAIGLRAHLEALDMLSPGERLLLDELLARIAAAKT